ncbi:linoleate diol synthase [Lactarius akahatsu]|uniref:Linoleate diol synthase n=1 Tax=Lactarius akahatsu TaxID=416441 RepID=A0AAD4LCM4_9AGAM|nr:linoleate diol synthase [Lactarius akahatsu]
MSSSKSSSKFLSRASVGEVVSSSYNLLTTAGQTINPIKSAPATQTYDNEAAVKDFQNAFKKSIASYHEPSAIAAGIDAFKHINSLDDRKMGLEHVVALLSKHSDGIFKDKVAEFENKLIEILYDDLSHPPATYIGPKYQYRSVDGSNNNISDPNMGKAAMPYARSVQQTHPIPRNTLPDAGLVFDTLLKRKKFEMHPGGLSSMMFSFAALVIHTVFRTSHKNVNINETSSYVDLAPLYGNDKKRLDQIRVHDGRGLIHPDTFAEERLMFLPPAVCVILVLFSRNHNHIANKLFEINERQTYIKPGDIPHTDKDRAKKIADQDEDIFQTARLINCAWFGSAIFSDYFSSILGLPRQGSTWSLNPFGEIRDSDHKLFERGRGNVCSVEFNCLYRWHATTSEADEKWVEQSMGNVFKGKQIDKLETKDFKAAVEKLEAELPDVSRWTFGQLKRGPDGKFDDKELAAIIKDAVEHPAARFGARGTPHVMRLHEIMGIEANRRWGVCSLNEFRKARDITFSSPSAVPNLNPTFNGLILEFLTAYTTFLEWNSDKEIAEAAEHLYSHIDNLELYVGLQAEQAKEIVDGAGLCPVHLPLHRGDRYFTADFTPFNLTAWGFADSQRDPKGPGNGSMLGRLILRGLPGEFSKNSVYTWFPLQTPASMQEFLGKLGTADRYDFQPSPQPPPLLPSQGNTMMCNKFWEALSSVTRTATRPHASSQAKGEFFLASEPDQDAESQRDQTEVLRVLRASPERAEQIANYFYEKTRELINIKSYSLNDKNVKYVDIVRDVLRYVPLHWAATELAGLTLKEDSEAWGDYTEPQLYEMITDIYSFLFLDVDPSKSMNLEARAKEHVEDLQRHIKANILADVGGKLSIANLVGTIQSLFNMKAKRPRLSVAEGLFESGASADRTTNNVLSLLVGASVELSQSIINIVNFYLDKPDVVKQLKAADAKNPALEAYIYEAMRIDPPFRGVYRDSLADQTVGSITYFKGQRVFVDLTHASHDPNVFPDPHTVNVKRKSKDRYLTGDGVTRSLGVDLTTKIMSQVLRAVFETNGVRRSPGLAGHLKRYKVAAENTLRYEYLGADYLPTAWPNTMVLQASNPRLACLAVR